VVEVSEGGAVGGRGRDARVDLIVGDGVKSDVGGVDFGVGEGTVVNRVETEGVEVSEVVVDSGSGVTCLSASTDCGGYVVR